QLIHNAAVVNAADWKYAPIFLIEQPVTALLQVEDIDDRNPQVALRGQKIAERFLLLRMDLQQDDIFRVVAADNYLPQQLRISIVVQAAEIDAQACRQSKRLNVFLCQHRLVSVEGRK